MDKAGKIALLPSTILKMVYRSPRGSLENLIQIDYKQHTKRLRLGSYLNSMWWQYRLTVDKRQRSQRLDIYR